MESISRVVAGVLGLAGFCAACVAGLGAGNDASTTLGRAIGCMVVCYVVGRVIGAGARAAVREHVESYRRDHPIEPASPDQTAHPDQNPAVPA